MLDVLLAQLPVPNNPALNVPLALGYLAAYARQKGLLDRVRLTILEREIADHAGDALIVATIVAARPDVLGLTLYTWNSERSVAIAARVKQQLPDVIVVVGGPEVQRDNAWLLDDPAIDVFVLGEGEQTFADLLRLWTDHRPPTNDDRSLSFSLSDVFLSHGSIPGIAARAADGSLVWTPERAAIADLAAIASPYLAGDLPLTAASMQLIEVSRWCPYGCSFCLYGRNMGPKLGNRYFGLARVLDEIRWGRAHGVQRVHFVEANLNLVPLFWPLMHALAELNADQSQTFYAELRAEHLGADVVAALDRANVRVVEVGLQTAVPDVLRRIHRRTDLQRWAAGTRRLYDHNIEVFLDVIVGLPGDDAAGVHATVQFIHDQQLQSYDVFMLQVLPGTAVRAEAESYALRFQERPPYYVLGTDRLDFAALQRLRHDLKLDAGYDPDELDGVPVPRPDALMPRAAGAIVDQLWLDRATDLDAIRYDSLAAHVDVVIDAARLDVLEAVLSRAIAHNPATLFDVYILAAATIPDAATILALHDRLPWTPGYLDRVAVYRAAVDHAGTTGRAGPRWFVVLPWEAQVADTAYRGVAGIIWRYDHTTGGPLPLNAWRGAGGDIWLCADEPLAAPELAAIAQWQAQTGRMVWHAAPVAAALPSAYGGTI